MRRSRSPASSYCSASARDNSGWDVWAFKAKLRRRSGTRCLGLEVSTVKREAFLLVTAICTRARKSVSRWRLSMDNPYLDVIAYVERLHRQFLEVVKLELEGFGIHDINNVQAMMLFNIGDAEMTVGELTLRGCYLGSNVSYNVRKMVENEYLAHERSVHDRRSIHVRLTEKGIKLRDSLATMHRRQAEMLSRAAVGADDLQAVGVTLRRLERFWIRAADLVQRPQPLAPGSSSPAQPLFA